MMIKRLFSASLVALVLFLWAAGANAQQLKIGYVDPQTILNKMPEMAAVQKKLENFADEKRQAYAQKQEDFQQQVQDFQQKSAVISDAAKKREQARLDTLNQQLVQLQAQIKQELQNKQQQLMSPILNKVQNAINDVAKSMGLTYVFNTMTGTGDYIILYASDEAQKKYDITQKVMDKLNL